MTDYLIELFNIFGALAINFPLLLYPMWEAREVSPKFVRNYIICYAVLLCAAVFVARQLVALDINTIQILKLGLLVPQLALPLYAFRKRMWQAVLLIAVCLLTGPIFTGIGNYTAEILFPGNAMFYAGIINLAAGAVLLIPLIIIMRRICQNPHNESVVVFWQRAWVVPITFHALIITQGTYLSDRNFGFWFIAVRLISYVMSIFVYYMYDIVTRKMAEAGAAKLEAEKLRLEAEKLAEINVFYHRMAHDLLTPLTKVSTNVQIAWQLKPDDIDELLMKSHDEIMKMSGMINKTLNEGGGVKRE